MFWGVIVTCFVQINVMQTIIVKLKITDVLHNFCFIQTEKSNNCDIVINKSTTKNDEFKLSASE